MKKVLIPIFHGHIARNILRTTVLPELAKKAEVIIIVPAFKRDSYEKEFGGKAVTVIASPDIKYSALDKFFRAFYYYFVDTRTVRIIQQEQFLETNKTRYFLARLFTKIFGDIKIFRQILRLLDWTLVKDTTFKNIFDTHKPDIVFIPSITSDDEGLVLRQAKTRGTKTVGMVRSWDNITVNKGNIRVFPDKLLTHTEILKEDCIRYADYPRDRVEVVGMSHFDYYITDKRIPRDEFFKKIGGDPKKKTIYFMPIGLSDIEEDKYMLGLLETLVRSDKSFANVQLMLSLHPNATKPIDYAAPETLFIKPPKQIDFPGGKPTDREITREAMELMASAIYHSDLVVNYQGTTSIDVSAFDKPVINIAFDGSKERPYLKSVRRFYDFTHYQPILKTGGVRLARSGEELKSQIVEYLKHPELDHAGRKKITEEQCPKHDGKASQRTAKAILNF